MTFAYRFSLLALLFLVSACSTTKGVGASQRIEITEADNGYRLSVPVSQLMMIVPKGNWSPKDRSSDNRNPRYFYFEDKREASLILSGWFEPDRLFIGVSKLWEADTRRLKETGLPEPVNVSFEKLGGWDIVMYDLRLNNLVSSHIRAHWVQSGTWIDIHLSTTTTRSSDENRRHLKSLLRGISINKKAMAADAAR